MAEHPGAVTMKGNPLTLAGDMPNTGDKAPEFTALSNDLAPVSLSDYHGKVVILSAVPSLDTPTCDKETRRFNEEAAKLSGDVAILTISADLPFANKRWCAANGIEQVVTLSDHKEVDFATKYGVLIKELRLLARVVFVVDRNGDIQYRQVVEEISAEPDYAPILAKARELL